MKKSMPDYISVLSENKFELLEEIFEDKYQKFTQLYWMIKEYSDSIVSLKYKSTKKDVLKIQMSVEGLDIVEVLTGITNSIDNPEDVNIWSEGNIIHIEITKEESVPH